MPAKSLQQKTRSATGERDKDSVLHATAHAIVLADHLIGFERKILF